MSATVGYRSGTRARDIAVRCDAPACLAVLRRVAPVVLLLGSFAGCRPAQAAPGVPLVGDWQLDTGRSHYGAGVERRRDERMTCTMDGGRLGCVVRSVRADGRELTARFAAAPDGRTAPVTGIPDVDAVQLRRGSDSYVDATFLWRGAPAFGYRAFRSADGRSLMIVAVDPVTRAAATSIVVYRRR